MTNSLPDNAGPLAGDGFDDAWQQAVGIATALDPNALREGVPYWQLYAMGINPTAPVAGPLVKAKVEDDGHPSVTFTWNPSAAGYSFVVQQATDLDGGFVNLVDPALVWVERADGLWQVTVRGPVPVEGVDHQFLRVQILRP